MASPETDASPPQEGPAVSVIIPAFNEGEAIAEVVGAVLAQDASWEVIVVDDGSKDTTADVARRAGATVVVHPYNLGNGAAVKSGARAAKGRVLVYLDADGQHPPSSIPKLLDKIGPYDMVVGARTKDSKVSRFRGVGNWGLIKYARWITGHPILDLTSGFRAIKRERMLEFLHLLPQRYSYPTTITIAMFSAGYFVDYVPMPEIQRRATGTSGIKPFRDGFRFLHIIMRTTLLFSPTRVFGPPAVLLFLAGVALGAYQYRFTGGLRLGSGLLWMTGFMCLLLGLLSEQIAYLRRRPSH